MRKFVAGVMSLLFSAFMIFTVLSIIYFNVKLPVNINADTSIFAVPQKYFMPEPMERLLFYIGVIITPILLYFSYKIFRIIIDRFNDETVIRIGKILNMASIIIILISMAIYYSVILQSKEYGLLFYGNYMLAGVYSNKMLAWVLFCVGMICLLYGSIKFKIKHLNNKIVLNVLNYVSWTIILLVFAYCVFGLKVVNEYFVYANHFNAVFYSMVQVYLGKAILVDIVHQYGLYPHFIEPLFRVFGLSVLKFTVIMGLLLAVAVYCLYRFMVEICVNKAIGCIGFITMLFYCYLFSKGVSHLIDYYFQYYPIRFFFPAISIYCVYRYLVSKNKITYYLIFLTSSISILWNFDSGIVLFISWMLLLLFEAAYKRDVFAAIIHIIKGIGILAFVVLSYSIYIFYRYGSFPNFNMFYNYQKYYYQFGLNMLPMKLIDPWNVVIIIYAIALLFAFISMIERKRSVKDGVLLYLSVLGFGLFMYYQGRSHILNLLAASYPAVLILGILIDEAIELNKKKEIVNQLLLNGLIMFFCFSSLFCFLILPTMGRIIYNRLQLTLAQKPTQITRNIDFIQKNISKNESPLILSGLAGIYYLAIERPSPINLPSVSELVLNEDYEKIYNKFREAPAGDKIVLDRNVNNDEILKKMDGYYFMEKYSTEGNIIIYKKKEMKNAENPDGGCLN